MCGNIFALKFHIPAIGGCCSPLSTPTPRIYIPYLRCTLGGNVWLNCLHYLQFEKQILTQTFPLDVFVHSYFGQPNIVSAISNQGKVNIDVGLLIVSHEPAYPLPRFVLLRSKSYIIYISNLQWDIAVFLGRYVFPHSVVYEFAITCNRWRAYKQNNKIYFAWLFLLSLTLNWWDKQDPIAASLILTDIREH